MVNLGGYVPDDKYKLRPGDRIVVEEIRYVAKPLGKFLAQALKIGGLEHERHQGQMGALDFEGGGRVSCEGNRHGRNRLTKKAADAGTAKQRGRS